MSDWIINDILKRSEEAEARKPRINCPTHGNTLICASCRKCLSCIWEEGKASQLRWCLKRRRTNTSRWSWRLGWYVILDWLGTVVVNAIACFVIGFLFYLTPTARAVCIDRYGPPP